MKKPRLITLTTDFGTADGYVGSVKGAILSINPAAKVVDLSNDIPSYDIVIGAYHLGCAAFYYPKGTIHVAVVDPGVGSSRCPLLLVTKNHYFVGPDNGLFTLVARREPVVAVYELTQKKYFLSNMSSTFHGRDLFGPVAAHLSRGLSPSKLGPKRDSFKKLTDFDLREDQEGWHGKILFFDKFGNAFSNIHLSNVSEKDGRVVWKGQEIPLYRTYSEIPQAKPGAIFGSSGFLEIALREDSFIQKYQALRGEGILLKK